MKKRKNRKLAAQGLSAQRAAELPGVDEIAGVEMGDARGGSGSKKVSFKEQRQPFK